MPRRSTPYHPGPIAIDDLTGFKVPHRDLKRQWDGAYTVDPDKRNPQDLIRARGERAALPHPRPEATDTFLASPILTEDGLPMIGGDGQIIFTEGSMGGEGL